MPQQENRPGIPRRRFLKFAIGAAGAAVALRGCRIVDQLLGPLPPCDEGIRCGETQLFPYFSYSNQVQGLGVRIESSKLEQLSKKFAFPLWTPQLVNVSFTDEKKFDNPMQGYSYIHVGPDKSRVRIQIAGGRFIDEVLNNTGHPPQDERDAAFLSAAHSVALIDAHLELAALIKKISFEEARKKSRAYVESVVNAQSPTLPSRISITG